MDSIKANVYNMAHSGSKKFYQYNVVKIEVCWLNIYFKISLFFSLPVDRRPHQR